MWTWLKKSKVHYTNYATLNCMQYIIFNNKPSADYLYNYKTNWRPWILDRKHHCLLSHVWLRERLLHIHKFKPGFTEVKKTSLSWRIFPFITKAAFQVYLAFLLRSIQILMSHKAFWNTSPLLKMCHSCSPCVPLRNICTSAPSCSHSSQGDTVLEWHGDAGPVRGDDRSLQTVDSVWDLKAGEILSTTRFPK